MCPVASPTPPFSRGGSAAGHKARKSSKAVLWTIGTSKSRAGKAESSLSATSSPLTRLRNGFQYCGFHPNRKAEKYEDSEKMEAMRCRSPSGGPDGPDFRKEGRLPIFAGFFCVRKQKNCSRFLSQASLRKQRGDTPLTCLKNLQ